MGGNRPKRLELTLILPNFAFADRLISSDVSSRKLEFILTLTKKQFIFSRLKPN